MRSFEYMLLALLVGGLVIFGATTVANAVTESFEATTNAFEQAR